MNRLEAIKARAKASAPIGEQANHAVDQQLGGRRSSELRVITELRLPSDFEVQPGTPGKRGACSAVARPCPFISCRHHLWLRAQSEQPGNPKAGKQGETTLHPATTYSCALDVAAFGPQSFETIGKLFGAEPSGLRKVAARALRKLKASGLTVDELLEAL